MAHVIVMGAGLGGIPAAFVALPPIYQTFVLKALGIASLKMRVS